MGSIHLFIFLLAVHIILAISPSAYCHTKQPKIPAILIFGDSTVDTGNNNYITTTVAKANFPPYGVSFPNHLPTGRFSDGRLVPDFLASALGIKELIPPFLNPSLSDNDLRTGVSFASAGSGFDSLTTVVTGAIPVADQPGLFKRYVEKLKASVGEEKANKIISKSLIVISAGTNDFVLNWYDLPSSRRLHFSNDIGLYQNFILGKLGDLIKEIYNLGGRIFGVAGLGPIGCVPLQITAKLRFAIGRTCVEEQNTDAIAYNAKLQKLLPQLQASLPRSQLLYANIFDPFLEIHDHPEKYGIVEISKGCCGLGLVETGPLCNSLVPRCPNPSQFMFWDAVHPSEVVYKNIAQYLVDNVIPEIN